MSESISRASGRALSNPFWVQTGSVAHNSGARENSAYSSCSSFDIWRVNQNLLRGQSLARPIPCTPVLVPCGAWSPAPTTPSGWTCRPCITSSIRSDLSKIADLSRSTSFFTSAAVPTGTFATRRAAPAILDLSSSSLSNRRLSFSDEACASRTWATSESIPGASASALSCSSGFRRVRSLTTPVRGKIRHTAPAGRSRSPPSPNETALAS